MQFICSIKIGLLLLLFFLPSESKRTLPDVIKLFLGSPNISHSLKHEVTVSFDLHGQVYDLQFIFESK